MPPAKKTAEAKPAEGAGVTQSGAEMRRRLGEQEHEEISIKLAHLLPEGNEFTEDGAEAKAGTTITVKRHQARHLIAAGYAAVDNEDAEAVRTALFGGGGEPPADGEQKDD